MPFARKYAILKGRRGGQHLVGGNGTDTLRLSGIAGANYLEIEPDGTARFVGAATVWDDLRAPATAINPPGQISDPDWDNTNGGWLFDDGGTEILWIVLQFHHSYKEGSDIVPHLHWQPKTTGSGNVLWRIEYKWTNREAADAGSFTQVDLLTPADGTAFKHQEDKFAAQSGSGKTISSIITIKLSRIGGDGTDTYSGDALLKEFDIHFEIDRIGSIAEDT